MMEGSALDLANNVGLMTRGYGRNGYNDDGFGFGGNGIWLLIILFFIMFAGGNGFGGWGGNGAMNQLTNEFLFTNLNQSIQRGNDFLVQQNFGLQKDLCQGFNGLQMQIAESRYAADKCCCETNRNIDAVRYENSKNTCDIITAGQANTQRILDFLTSDKIDQLRVQLQLTQGELSQTQQTQAIVNQLRPCPIPAYISCSPYMSYVPNVLNGNGCGCNNGNGWVING